ncbi:hypothetical protein ASPZODRAFT_74543 [Penicilliopsis zonata CBS 506.65]|uniref:Polynucleotide adenylyltransferase n=1 Tax=Penicilliopsis zonata CBS 506.65 TaxID=1073090 RepID=A0A1L9S875_9EURO|nr:hypothetical protein ASPZODRAFT_74543 [Penicilliopsis zonata CBS 506.65]OJJ43359.1 hypothetical protein ASPZODRAFT_74543 [Penicilliopsis zonata CBS 506.65]
MPIVQSSLVALSLPRRKVLLPPALCRFCHASSPFLKDGRDIYPDNLAETLQAHRNTNRARLIRKVYTLKPPKGIRRPVLLPPIVTNPENTPTTPAAVQPGTASKPAKKATAPGRKALRNRGHSKTAAELASRSDNSRKKEGTELQWAVEEPYRPGQYPWLLSMRSRTEQREASEWLDAEIRALETYISPTHQEQTAVDHIVSDLAETLDHDVPYPLQLVGSRQTGLSPSHADLSFVLVVEDNEGAGGGFRKPSATRPKVMARYLNLLRKAQHVLVGKAAFRDIRLVGKRMPVLTSVHVPSGLSVRFSCKEGLPAFPEHVRDYQAEYPTIRPLYLAVRLILEARGIFGAHKASIDSDALILLLAAFLKINHGRFSHPAGLSNQLLSFLHTYGSDIDFRSTGISAEPPRYFTAETVKKDAKIVGRLEELSAALRGQRSLINQKRTAAAKRNSNVADRLCIQDPTNYMTDLGRPCTRTAELQTVFLDTHDKLRSSLHAWDQSRDRTQSILGRALHANFDAFEHVRNRIVACAGPSSS